MERRQPPTTGSPTPSTDGADAQRTAIAALVHRLNGGLNNASLALEIALGDERDTVNSETLRAGLAAIGQASRAAMLLARLVDGRRSSTEASELYAKDVHDILTEHARTTGRSLSGDFSAAAIANPDQAIEALVTEIVRMQARAG